MKHWIQKSGIAIGAIGFFLALYLGDMTRWVVFWPIFFSFGTIAFIVYCIGYVAQDQQIIYDEMRRENENLINGLNRLLEQNRLEKLDFEQIPEVPEESKERVANEK